MTFLSCPWPLKSKYTAGIYMQAVHLRGMLFFFSVRWRMNCESRWRTNMISLTKNKTDRENQSSYRKLSKALNSAVNNPHRLKAAKLKVGKLVYLAKRWRTLFKLCPLPHSFLVICVLEDGSSLSAWDNVNHAADECRETNLSHKGVFVRLLPVCCEITRALCETVQTRHRHHGKAQ